MVGNWLHAEPWKRDYKGSFDRGGYIYHGRVAEVAAGAREAGLEFWEIHGAN